MTTPERILSFWFGDDFIDGFPAISRDVFWFESSPVTDQNIKRRFAADIDRAARGELALWESTPTGLLALIILLDQFPRNIHRGTATAFAHDGRARELCLAGIRSGADQKLRYIERTFFYLPLEHSEDIEHQNLCVAMLKQITHSCEDKHREQAKKYLSYAVTHQQIIAKFGRFPHRNAALGRDSSVAELQFLQHGPAFGQ